MMKMEKLPQGKRRPRFQRVALPTGIQLVARDYEILEAVYRHRLISTKHLIALLPESSPQTTTRRLQQLFHHRFLDRPRVQVGDLYLVRGSAPMAYALDRKGAEALSESFRIPLPELNWRAKNRALKRVFYEHTLFTASVMVNFEVACMRRGNVEMMEFPEILATRAPAATRELKRPQTWRARVTSQESSDIASPMEPVSYTHLTLPTSDLV